jgi:hypothetical protein
MNRRRCVPLGTAGGELRVYFQPESAHDLLHSQVKRFDFGHDVYTNDRHMLQAARYFHLTGVPNTTFEPS